MGAREIEFEQGTGRLVAVRDDRTVEDARAEAVERADAAYEAARRAGVTPDGFPAPLAARESDVTKFTQLVVLLRELDELQPDDAARAAFRASPVTIVDATDAPHTMSVAQFRGVVASYGLKVNALWSEVATRRALANAAKTRDEADAVAVLPAAEGAE